MAKTKRDSHGRFQADHRTRNSAVAATALVGAAAAGLAALFKFGILDRFLPATEGHAAPDLALDAADQHRFDQHANADAIRAPEHFRPDMDAPMTAAEREALRPATGGAPTLSSNEGDLASA